MSSKPVITPKKSGFGSFFQRKASFRTTETESLVSLSNESYRVAKEMRAECETKLKLIESLASTSLIQLQEELDRLVKLYQETEIVWKSVLKVLEEEKESGKDCFTADREEIHKDCFKQLEIIQIELHWIQLHQIETVAAMAFEKTEKEKQYSRHYETYATEAMKKLVQAQHGWKKLLLTLPYPEQTVTWNARFDAQINYPVFTFSFWSNAWKTALKCRYETVVEMKKLKQASNAYRANNRNEVARTEYSLDKLIEYKESEENIWDELIKTCQILRQPFITLPSLHDDWKLLFQEIELQKSYTLLEKSFVSVEIIRYQILAYVDYPLIKYNIQKVEKKRKNISLNGREYIDYDEVLTIIGADVKRIERMCLLWQDYQKEHNILQEYCHNTIQLYQQLQENHPNDTQLGEQEDDDIILQHSQLLLASLQWKTDAAERLWVETQPFLSSVTSDTNDNDPNHDRAHLIARNKRKLHQLVDEVEAALRKYPFATWRPDFPKVKLMKFEQIIDISVVDYLPTSYEVVPMKVFLEIIDRFSEIKPYKAELSELLLGVPDAMKSLAETLVERIRRIETEMNDNHSSNSAPQTPTSSSCWKDYDKEFS